MSEEKPEESSPRNNDTIGKTLIVTVLLCLFCSIVVSTAAVSLKPMQEENKALDMKRNILAAAGMLENKQAGKSEVDELFGSIEIRAVDITTGRYTDAVDVESYSPRKAAKDPSASSELSDDVDVAKIGRLENVALVYLVKDNRGKLEKIILPVRGYGLWSTLHGFLALEKDFNTVVGLGFYEHGETPGLGGEVDNPRWKAHWPGKKVYGPRGEVQLGLIKGTVDTSRDGSQFQVDGLSGATLTSNGVTNLVRFWLGENAYGKFLSNLKTGGA